MPDSNKLALIIGIDTYQKDLDPLPSCKKDAEDVFNLLKKIGYEIFSGSPIIGSEIIEDTTGFIKINDSITKFFKEGNKSQTLIFYFSGHGINDKGENYLATPYVDPENPDPMRAISYYRLTKLMEQSQSLRIVGIIDSCFSGGLEIPPHEKIKSSQKRTKAAVDAIDRTFDNMPQTKNYTLLLSSHAYEHSRAKENDNSYYTKYLLEGLEGIKCVVDKDGNIIGSTGSIDQEGYVTPQSLHYYILSKVMKDQNPQLKIVCSYPIHLANYRERLKIDRAWDLVRRLNDEGLTHKDRQIIGDQLEKIDPRQGVGIGDDGLPKICWIRILSGTASINYFDQISIEAVKQKVEPFFIAAYEVTVAQYKSFLKDQKDYEARQWWTNLRKTPYDIMTEKLRLQRDNYPVVEVNWYEAVAFCRWLNVKKQGLKLPPHEEFPEKTSVIGENFVIRLPTIWEWVQAATGGHSENCYPWGRYSDNWKKANTASSGLGRAMAVGMYPEGRTSDGVMDMLGNVSEWCINQFDENLLNPFKNTEITAVPTSRILMGGSWNTDFTIETENFARDAHMSPSSNNLRGFRILCGCELKQ